MLLGWSGPADRRQPSREAPQCAHPLGLLRERRDRPRCRTAKQTDELTPPHYFPRREGTDVAVLTGWITKAPDVRFGPKADIATIFDDLICLRECRVLVGAAKS